MSVVAELQAPVEYLAIFERASARVAAWNPVYVPKVAAPRAGTPVVERRGARPVPHRGGRLHSLIPCVLAVALPWSAAIYVGGGFR